jgi:hypothetical protein
MTTLAGRKIREFREAQNPRITRDQFARAHCGLTAASRMSTVQGWEEEGKRPTDARIVNALARAGICTHAEWYMPAVCPRCELRSDAADVAGCARAGCPLAHSREEAA